MPSFVKGLGKTSFIPGRVRNYQKEKSVCGSPYRKYMSISSARIFEVMAMIGMCGRISRIQTVAETPSR